MPEGEFQFPSFQESKTVFFNDVTVTAATPTLTFTGSASDLDFFMGLANTDGATPTWEGPVTSGTKLTVVATGKFLKWKAVGVNVTITKIEIQVNPT